MPKLPSFRRLYEQDYPKEDQELVQQLAVSINAGFEQLYDLLNGKLTIEDNLASKVKTVQFMVDSNGIPTTKVIIKKSNSEKLSGLNVIRVDNLTNSNAYPISGPFITYLETTDTIVIKHITGLIANNSYQINVELLR